MFKNKKETSNKGVGLGMHTSIKVSKQKYKNR